MVRRNFQNLCRVPGLAICVGFVLPIASSAEEAQSKPSEEPVVTQSPDPRSLLKAAFITPRALEVQTVPLVQAGDAGSARVQACTDVKGKVTKAQVMESSGNLRVDSWALAIVSLSQFSPAVVKDKPKAACTVMPITVAAPKNSAEIDSLPDPWKGNKSPTVAFVPQDLPRPSGMVAQGLTIVCVDAGSKVISATMTVSSGDKAKDKDMVDWSRRFQINAGAIGGKRVAGCLLVPQQL